ncbi:MAG: hypothetical protein K2K60_01255 [Clostridia bacterium]|nr:hypothetical protein [Clostridia bacterium]
MLIDKIDELNKALYKAFGELHENKGHINKPEHQEGIANNIYALYMLDYKLIRGTLTEEDKLADELDIQELVRKNEITRRKKELAPEKKRRWWAPWTYKTNRAEDLLARESGANADILLNTREQAIEKLEAIVEAADEETTEALKPLSRKERREQKRQARLERKEQKRATRNAQSVREPAGTEIRKDKPDQVQGQLTLDDVQAQPKPTPPAAASTTLTAKK